MAPRGTFSWSSPITTTVFRRFEDGLPGAALLLLSALLMLMLLLLARRGRKEGKPAGDVDGEGGQEVLRTKRVLEVREEKGDSPASHAACGCRVVKWY